MSVAILDTGPTTVLPSALAGRGGLVQFTVDDVQAMMRQGLLEEDASKELLNGLIVHTDRSEFGGDPKMHSPGHRASVAKLTNLAGAINGAQRHIQIQSPIKCGRRQMPEPDFAVVRGSVGAYSDRLPAAADVFCLIEVADSSLERDRSEKLPIYARSGIERYIILNLRNRTAEIYTGPDANAGTYAGLAVVDGDAAVEMRVGDSEMLSIGLAELLP